MSASYCPYVPNNGNIGDVVPTPGLPAAPQLGFDCLVSIHQIGFEACKDFFDSNKGLREKRKTRPVLAWLNAAGVARASTRGPKGGS